MSSVTGLSAPHRAHARRIISEGCELLLRHAAEVHYTEGPYRWGAINSHLEIRHGQYLRAGDCSSTATWLLWNGLFVPYGVRDVVNGQDWRAGYTGTMLDHGKPVVHEANAQVGDLAIYGPPPGLHVAVCLGGGLVFSHGSEGGPYKLPLHYRDDRVQIRRYI